MGGDERAAGGIVLVVDDDQATATVVSRMLERGGYRTAWATSGAAAMEVLEREGRVVLIVTDLRMPGMPGADLVRRARALHPQVAAVYISGYPEDPTAPPGAAVLEKPFTGEALLRTVGDALAGG
jgi:two-component system, cell cycle sensor histidine kinase and response regulator CckA